MRFFLNTFGLTEYIKQSIIQVIKVVSMKVSGFGNLK